MLGRLSIVVVVLSATRAQAGGSTCHGTVLNETGVNGRTIQTIDIPDNAEAASFCCAACEKARICGAWVVHKTHCYLKQLWSDNKKLRSNIKGNKCVGRVGTGFNTGKVYSSFASNGTTYEPGDKTCCDACNRDALCQGWQIQATGRHAGMCGLLKLSYDTKNRQTGFSPKFEKPPHPAFEGNCQVMGETEGVGKFVDKAMLLMTTQEDQDAECCSYCSHNALCEFWVRDTDSATNWCRLYKNWTRNSIWKAKSRTGFKEASKADAIYCKAIDGLWRVAHYVMERITFNVGEVKDLRVHLGPRIQCEKLSFDQGMVTGSLYDVQVDAYARLDTIKGINGNASVSVRADPNIIVDFNKCELRSFRVNDWNDGFGIDGNTGAHQILTRRGLLSGSFHSNLRRTGCGGALTGLPNHEPFSSATEIERIKLNGGTHYANDMECCQRCQANHTCDAWHTSKGYVDNGVDCRLTSFWQYNEYYRGNWKTETTPLENALGLGHTHAVLYMNADTQDERDAECALQCVSDNRCDLWVQSANSRECRLQGALRNSGWLGVGRPVVNLIVDLMVGRVLQTLVQKVCNNGGLQVILKILETLERWSFTGAGVVNLDVQEGFWDTPASDFTNRPDLYENLSITSTLFALESIQAEDLALRGFAKDFVRGLIDDFMGGKVAEELGSPVAFFIGGLIKSCVESNCDKMDIVI